VVTLSLPQNSSMNGRVSGSIQQKSFLKDKKTTFAPNVLSQLE